MTTRVYGIWNTPEDVRRCVESVHEEGRSVRVRQCRRTRGHGPEGLYCTPHGKKAQARLDAEATRASVWAAEQAKTPAERAAEEEAWRQENRAYRRAHFAVDVRPSPYDPEEVVLLVSTNGTHWRQLGLLPEEWQQVFAHRQQLCGEAK